MNAKIVAAVILLVWVLIGVTYCHAADRVATRPPDRPVMPIPEPGSWALMGIGLAVVVWAIRRRDGGDD